MNELKPKQTPLKEWIGSFQSGTFSVESIQPAFLLGGKPAVDMLKYLFLQTPSCDTVDRIDGFFPSSAIKIYCGLRIRRRDGKRLGHAAWMRVRPRVQTEYIVGGWIQFYTYTRLHPTLFGCVWRWAPPVMAIFWWEKSEKKPVNSGKIHQNPVMFRYQTHSAAPDASSAAIFYISLHHGSQASLFAKRHGSFQFYRGSFAGAGFSCPGRTFGCTLGHPRIRWNSPPVAPPKENRSNTKLGFLGRRAGNSSYLALQLRSNGDPSARPEKRRRGSPKWLPRSKWFY